MTTTEQLADALTASGGLPVAWRCAFLAVRREWFVPPRIWVDDEHGDPVAVDRDSDPDTWRAAVYANQPILTQFDDGHTRWPDTGGRHCTSSASQPDLVLRMLDALDVTEGQHVLEIGTGTGYNAALLATRVGPTGSVTSVDIDATLADTARGVLAEHGFPVTVLTADGATGHSPGAPYDRIIATASIPLGQVPYAWVRQTRPDGLIVAPIRTEYAAGCELVRLTVHSGTATGHPVGPVAFMPLRQYRTERTDPAELITPDAPVRTSHTRLKPWRVADTWAARWAIGTRVPACRWHHRPPATGHDGNHSLWLTDRDSRSWARVDYTSSAAPRPVRQAGPRNLWDEVEAAFRDWKALGRPEPGQTTLTVTAHDQQATLAHAGVRPPV